MAGEVSLLAEMLRETEYRDYTQVNIRFRIPHDGEPAEHSYVVDYRGLDYDA